MEEREYASEIEWKPKKAGLYNWKEEKMEIKAANDTVRVSLSLSLER